MGMNQSRTQVSGPDLEDTWPNLGLAGTVMTFSSSLTKSNRTSGNGQGQLDILLGLIPVKESQVEGAAERDYTHSKYIHTKCSTTCMSRFFCWLLFFFSF